MFKCYVNKQYHQYDKKKYHCFFCINKRIGCYDIIKHRYPNNEHQYFNNIQQNVYVMFILHFFRRSNLSFLLFHTSLLLDRLIQKI